MDDLVEVAEPRELVGRLVRQIWVEWARAQPDPKPSWLTAWGDLDDGQREVDMRIGEALFAAGQRSLDHELDAALARVAELEAENERLREAVFSSPEMARLLAAIDAVPPARPAEDPTTRPRQRRAMP